MKQILGKYLCMLMVAMTSVSVMAQDDDMYFDTSKKPQPTRQQVVPARTTVDDYTFSPSDYCGTTRSDDEYNRRGAYRRGYRQGFTGADSTSAVAGASDVIMLDSMSSGPANYRDTLQMNAAKPDGDSQYREDADYSGDYTYYDRLKRFDGYRNNTVVVVADPWYYNSWYDPWFYGSYYYPWYDSWYYPWYDPWYDPWYYSHIGWYGPGWGFSWGWRHSYYGPYWGGPHWGGVSVTRHHSGAHIAGRDGSMAGRRHGTFQRNPMTGSRRDEMGSSSSRQRGTGSFGRGNSSINRSSSSYPSSSSSRNINNGSMSRSSGSFGGGSMTRGGGGGGMSRGGGGGMSRGGGMGRH